MAAETASDPLPCFEPVRVGSNGTRVNATVALRAAVPAGTAFLVEDGAALATGEDVEVSPA